MRILPLTLLAFTCLPAAAQTTWHVNLNGVPPGNGTVGTPYTSIQFAIDQGSTVSGDTVLVHPGTYVELVDFSGKTLTVQSTGGAGVTTIDANLGFFLPDMACVTIDSGEGPATRLEGFRLVNGLGNLDPGFTFSEGGCLLLRGTSPTIADCVITNGQADSGGGLFSSGGSPQILRTKFLGNGQKGPISQGGGAYVEFGSVLFEDCEFTNNQAGLNGGGLLANLAGVSIDSCQFHGNSCTLDGGGAYFQVSTADLTNSLIDGNFSSDGNGGGFTVTAGSVVMANGTTLFENFVFNDHTGGGAYVEAGGSLSFRNGLISSNDSALGGGMASFGTLVLEDTLVADNTSQSFQALNGNGGGLAVTGSAVVRRCVFVGNVAIEGPTSQGQGGAVSGFALLENCTIVGNTASNGGGGACGASLLNTIHRDNLPAALCAAPSVSYSNVEGGAAGIGNIDLDPLFWDASARDFHLLLGSPSINTGDPGSPLDPDGSRADMGAFPHEGSYSVEYCAAGTSSSGCKALMSSSGTPSATASAGFQLTASAMDGQRPGLVFFGANGRQANPWGNGTSLQCVTPPVMRGPITASGGMAGVCDGSITLDLNARWCPTCPKPAQNPGAGAVVQAQLWYRDPQNTSNQTTSLSDAIEFQVQP